MIEWLFTRRTGWAVLTLVALFTALGSMMLLMEDGLDPAYANAMLATGSGITFLAAFVLGWKAHKRKFHAAALFMWAFAGDMLGRTIESSIRVYFYGLGRFEWYVLHVAPYIRALELFLVVQILMVVALANSKKTPIEKGYPYFAIGILITGAAFFVVHLLITLSGNPAPSTTPP